MRAALKETAKKREMRYDELRKIEKGTRRNYHDDITVVVVYFDHRKRSPSSRSSKFKQNSVGCTTESFDIFSLGADENDDSVRD